MVYEPKKEYKERYQNEPKEKDLKKGFSSDKRIKESKGATDPEYEKWKADIKAYGCFVKNCNNEGEFSIVYFDGTYTKGRVCRECLSLKKKYDYFRI